MNPKPISTAERRRMWVFFLVSVAAMPLLLGVGVYHVLTLTGEATVLRRELLAGDGFAASRRIEGTVGPFLLGSAGIVLQLIPDAPAEARDALAAVNSASVGVYELYSAPTAQERRSGFAAADSAMKRNGWIRVVGVSERRQSFVVYVPAGETADDELWVCIAICDQKRLVVVSARADAGNWVGLPNSIFPN